MKKRILSLTLILSMLLACAVCLTGCSEESDPEYPVTVGSVTVDSEPVAVVVLNDSVADAISFIGYNRKIVARSDDCDQEFLRFAPSVGSASAPSVDAIAREGADLVFADSTLSDATRAALEEKGITVITIDPAADFNAIREEYITIGTVLGGAVSGKRHGRQSYDEFIEMINQYKSPAISFSNTAVYLYLDENGNLCTFVKGSFEQKLFNLNGAINALSEQEEAAVMPYELHTGSPSYIFYDDEAVLECLRSDDYFASLPALVNGKVCRIPRSSFYRYGTSCREAISDMAEFMKLKSVPTPDEATPDEADSDGGNDDEPDDNDVYYDDYDDDSDDGYSDEYYGDDN